MKQWITNGLIVTPNQIKKGHIAVEKGEIVEVASKLPAKADVLYDAAGNYIMPGLIETHGHMREPGMTTKEDVPHGTRAALAGGYTTIIDMPNTNPPTTTVKLVQEKREKIYPGRSYTDYAIFMGVGKDSLKELEKIDKKWIAGVKVFMAGHQTTPTTIPDDKTLAKIMQILAKRKIILCLHAEDQWLIYYYEKMLKPTNRTDAALWSDIRPMAVVATAAARAIALAEAFGTEIYLLHLSTPEEYALVKAAKERGVKVNGELVGYQLAFNTSDYKKYGNKIKVAPALRTPAEQNQMWDLVRDGSVDVLASEHTPHEWETKNQPDMWKAQAGTPGIQENMPAFITNWTKHFGKDTLEESLMKLATIASFNTAKIFGFKTKGEIAKGKAADFSIIDTKKAWNVKKSDLFSKCGWSAYEGMNLIGRPQATFLAGKKVYENGKVLSEAEGKPITY